MLLKGVSIEQLPTVVSPIVSKAAVHNTILADEDNNRKDGSHEEDNIQQDAGHEEAPEPSDLITEETTPSPNNNEIRPHWGYRTS